MSAYGNLGGAYSTPELAAERQLSALGDIGQEEGVARAGEAQRINQQRFGQKAAVAGLTAPQLVATRQYGSSSGTSSGQSSGSGTGNTVMTQPGKGLFGSILGGLGTAFTGGTFI